MPHRLHSAKSTPRHVSDRIAGVMPGASARRRLATRIIALATLGSGLVNLYSAVGLPLPERAAVLRGIFPLEFMHVARFITLLAGFALVVVSFNVYKRKKRAFTAAVVLACLSAG